MSLSSDFWSTLNNKTKENVKQVETKNLTHEPKPKKKKKSNDSLSNDFWSALDEDIAPVVEQAKTRVTIDVAPTKEDNKWYEGWFQKGALDDGVDLKNIGKTILGTGLDILEDLGAGILGMGEKAVDTFATLAPYLADMQLQRNAQYIKPEMLEAHDEDNEEFKKTLAKFVEKDLYNENEISRKLVSGLSGGFDYESNSAFGSKTDSLAQSGGQLLGTAALTYFGVPWWLTTGTTAFGSESEHALNEGATFDEAAVSSTIAAGAEVLTEKLSGGIKFGGKALDDALTDQLARGISNKFVRNLAKFGLDAAGEGAEEWITEDLNKFGQWLTYRDDEELKELLFSEEAMNEKIEAFIGGAAMGGVSNVGNAIKSKVQGVDSVTGFTKNEEAVVRKVYEDKVAEAEKNGKVTEKRKSKIYDSVLNDLENGYISIDTIEEVLGGDTYKSYKENIYKEQRNQLKSQLGEEVFSLVQSENGNGSRLLESYNEKARRSQAFEADLSQYDSKQQKTIQKAIESGVLNNTNRTHEMVDLIAKISADKDIAFDFTTNEKIKGTIFAVEGKIVNGYRTSDGITLNMDSPKYLQSTVGHEITHVLEGTEFYDTLKQTVFEYAKSKGEYDSRLASVNELYKEIEDADIEGELTADLVGDYLFQDSDFVHNLSVGNRNVFEKIYDEIKYLCKVATAGSKEARELEKVKKVFEDAYRANVKSKADTQTQHSLSEANGNDYADTFYSYMGKVVDGVKQEKLGASSVVNMLRGKGVKAEEIKWSGIEDFLEGKKSVTKAELQEFIKGSKLQIVEETRGGEAVNEFIEEWRRLMDYDLSTEDIVVDENFISEVEQALDYAVEEGNLEQAEKDHVMSLAQKVSETSKPSKWDDYKLDGGKNYRELVFKIPGSDYSNEAMKTHWGMDAEGVLAHARLQDFDTPNGKMLFIEEIQSDLHNEGHIMGYQPKLGSKQLTALKQERDALTRERVEMYPSLLEDLTEFYRNYGVDNPKLCAETHLDWSLSDRTKILIESSNNVYGFPQELQSRLNRYFEVDNRENELFKQSRNLNRGIPDAPFHDNYHEFVLKRLIREAAEKGYDSIGWTTADVQSERWSDDYAEGYRIEYDQDIPKFLNKYGKKWGAQVGKTNIGASSFDIEAETEAPTDMDDDMWLLRDAMHFEDEGTEVWTMPITDAMKQSVLYEGQPMYSLSENGETSESYGDFATPAKDLKLENDSSVESQDSNINEIPIGKLVRASDRGNYGYVEDYDNATGLYSVRFTSETGSTAVVEFAPEELTPITSAKELFPNEPDIEQFEYENASAVKEATEKRLAELAELDLSDPEMAAEYKTVLEAWIESSTKLLELDTKFSERADSLTDADAPPETTFDAPVKPDANENVAQVLKKGSKKPKRTIRSKLATALVDKGSAVEKLSLDTGNMELQAKWNSALPTNTDSMAQYFMEHGTDNVPALKKLLKEQKKSGKTNEFDQYMYHLRNIDSMTLQERLGLPNKAVFGDSVTAEISRQKVAKWEKSNPEFKQWAQSYYDISNHLLNELVKENLISRESADYLRKKYPHYIPIKRVGKDGFEVDSSIDSNKTGVSNPIKTATGGNGKMDPLGNAMAQHIQQTYRAIMRNRFGIELKNTLDTAVTQGRNLTPADDLVDSYDLFEERLLKPGSLNGRPTFAVFENGNRVEFEITEDLYDALKPASKVLSYRNPVLTGIGNARRKLLTVWNPVFALYRNPIKDMQDVAINSQHPVKTYANVPNAMFQLLFDGKMANEYHKNGGKSNTYYDSGKNQFKSEDNLFKKAFGLPFRAIESAGEFIEQVPRLAEYIASRKDGRSVERSMLDAARVTTNFAAGGDFTRFVNSHGCTFLNASVQGAAQHVRNFREATKLEGFKGLTKTLAKYVIAGVPAMIFNGLLWDDDEEYEELNDYVKENYYVVGKTNEGKFVRIPKGRTAAVMHEALEQMEHLVTGDDEADFSTFFDLFMDNIAPNNPLTDNMFAPIFQAATNNAWYSDDIVPSRLQYVPAEEQFDESTDALSKWLGEKTGLSPMKINYLLDQYSGGIGDVALPMMTPEAESGDDSFVGNLLAPWKKEITTDKVLNNKNPGDFFELADEIEVRSNAKNATEEDKMKALYMQMVGYEMSDLYAEKREIQSSNLPAETKYRQVRALQEEINELAKNALNSYKDVSIDGYYATVGDKRFEYSEYNEKWYEISGKYLDKEKEAVNRYDITPAEYWNNTDLYYEADYFFKYKPDLVEVANLVYGGKDFAPYAAELGAITADRDEYGNTINGSKKDKILDYINNQPTLNYGERIVMFKMNYPNDDTYNDDIFEYLNDRNDLNYDEKVAIFTQLGFDVDSEGYVTW